MNDQQQTEQQERPFGGFGDSATYDGGLQDEQYYNVTLAGIKSVYIDKGQWPGWKVEWQYAVEGTTEELKALTSEATGEESTAGPWLVVLVGKQRYDERKTRKIEANELIGREGMALVRFNDKGWPRVKAILPRQQATPAPTPSTAPVPVAAPAAPTQANENYDDLPF